MINMVGRGRISVCGAADLARNAMDDGLINEAVAAFASLGSHGTSPSNSERDMLRWLKNLFGITLEPYSVTFNLQVFDLD